MANSPINLTPCSEQRYDTSLAGSYPSNPTTPCPVRDIPDNSNNNMAVAGSSSVSTSGSGANRRARDGNRALIRKQVNGSRSADALHALTAGSSYNSGHIDHHTTAGSLEIGRHHTGPYSGHNAFDDARDAKLAEIDAAVAEAKSHNRELAALYNEIVQYKADFDYAEHKLNILQKRVEELQIKHRSSAAYHLAKGKGKATEQIGYGEAARGTSVDDRARSESVVSHHTAMRRKLSLLALCTPAKPVAKQTGVRGRMKAAMTTLAGKMGLGRECRNCESSRALEALRSEHRLSTQMLTKAREERTKQLTALGGGRE